MTIDFSQFGAAGNIDPTVLDDQATGGSYVLPEMKNCVLTIIDVGMLENNSGWQAANFEVQVSHDGGSGQHVGKSTKYSITLNNPSFPDGGKWGIEELKRWAAACGLQQLNNSNQLIGKSFMCDAYTKPNKKDPSKQDQKIGNLRQVGTTAPAQAPAQGFAAPAQQPAAQPASFAPPAGGFNPQQGGMPAFAQPQ